MGSRRGPAEPGVAGCPSRRPLAGDACTTPDALCDYEEYCTGSVGVGPRLVCDNGYWEKSIPLFYCGDLTCSQIW
ncbi:MAG TPA: hypothetical protein VH062_04980 [Polyangiaceae bacterium]|nr:hypothetical protein [Polyangiaceae bacterium]